MQLLDVIKNRRTIRKYKNEKVPKKVINDLLEAGRWAPSAHNLQPWKFVVIDTDKNIGVLADTLDKKTNDLHVGFNIILRETSKNIRQAKVIVLVYSTGEVSKKFQRFGPPYSDLGNLFELQSVSGAIENIMIYSNTLNLGVAWHGICLFCEKEISSLFEQTGKLVAVLSLGYPDEKPKESARKKITDIVEYIK